MRFLVINGVNLNMTGLREKGVYGSQSLDEINADIKAFTEARGSSVEFYQSNYEGDICTKLHNAYLGGECDAIILNAGAFTHYSYAIHDAITAINIPVVEVHMSNVHAREEFRHKSVISDAVKGVVAGFGKKSYMIAIESFLI